MIVIFLRYQEIIETADGEKQILASRLLIKEKNPTGKGDRTP